MSEWRDIGLQLERTLRLRTFPVGLKLLKDTEDMDKIKHRKPAAVTTLCQLIAQSRTLGWTVGFTIGDLIPACGMVVGLRDSVPESFSLAVGEVWFKDKEVALRKYAPENWPRIPGHFNAAVLSPLTSGRIEPDMIILFGTPAQMMRVINGLQWENYEKLEFSSCGESSCSDSIGRCYTTGKPAMTVPCFGERRYGHVQEEELIMALPPGYIDTLLKGLEALDKTGIRYPIPFYGAQADLISGFPPNYQEEIKNDQEAIRNLK
ncbi:MAG: DUF169 domain-containing protein [Dehalococcoidia bacterium]|nr:DUF169 domain-containing protein [Dehalococcoidia bacterium]